MIEAFFLALGEVLVGLFHAPAEIIHAGAVATTRALADYGTWAAESSAGFGPLAPIVAGALVTPPILLTGLGIVAILDYIGVLGTDVPRWPPWK